MARTVSVSVSSVPSTSDVIVQMAIHPPADWLALHCTALSSVEGGGMGNRDGMGWGNDEKLKEKMGAADDSMRL